MEEACESGIGVIAEPGGSIRDQDAVDCCNKYGVSLLFTNVRHFVRFLYEYMGEIENN